MKYTVCQLVLVLVGQTVHMVMHDNQHYQMWIIYDLTCCNLFKDEDGTHIIFRQYSHEEIERQKLNAKIEYLAMMGGIELYE